MPTLKGSIFRNPALMKFRALAVLRVIALLACSEGTGFTAGHSEYAAALPEGVTAVWDTSKAHCETTPTRERICLNGLWRWQPAEPDSTRVPNQAWGYFKVPGCWPGITDYMQKDSQLIHFHPAWEAVSLRDLAAAWYEREFTIPQDWAGRQVSLRLEHLNSLAVVYLDGARVGEIRFPGGDLELPAGWRPGAGHRLSLMVAAVPLRGVLLSYTDSASAREVKGSVARRGLCGDVYLEAKPRGPRMSDVRSRTSVRRGELTIVAELENLSSNTAYILRTRVTERTGGSHDLISRAFQPGQLDAGGRFSFTTRWVPDELWDISSPGAMCDLEVTLADKTGKVHDIYWNQRFGFREFWIDGRDFHLNGSRIQLSAVPLDNAQVGAAWATYGAARESLERLQSFGINFVYTHNYDCNPGAHLAFEEILRAADDVGMLVGLSQPHFSDYDWTNTDADRANGYARHAEFYVRVANPHPSVVMYAMSHNATGYSGDMNPDMIDGIQHARDDWAARNAGMARRAEAIVTRLDPSRIVYHHASGNLGPMHAVNFYPNFVPIQELSDWFQHWSTQGVKPLFLCEYGAPFTWDWTMYRGWFKGEREFGSARVPWEFCLAEWNAQFLGDSAFPASRAEKANLRWEAAQFRAGNLWHRWDYPYAVGSTRFDERYPVFAAYITDNWRAFRTLGVSAISPWEYGHFWKLREDVDRTRKMLPTDWENLQRPGFSPDFVEHRYERMDLAFDRSDWVPTAAAEALYRNNLPLLAWLAGKPDRLTSKDHLFLPGESVEKTLVIVNNSRAPVTADGTWTLDLPQPVSDRRQISLATGQQERWALRIQIPPATPPGSYNLRSTVRFDTGETQEDTFTMGLLPAPSPPAVAGRIAVFDPRGETLDWLRSLDISCQPIGADTATGSFDLLVVGKEALTLESPAPDIRRVREGLNVVIFEQTAEVLEKRFGFRVAEYGLRQVFPRVPDHPILRGLEAGHLRDWRGEAMLVSRRLTYEMRPRYGPTVSWCGLPVPRLWRCGNQGNVASVVIEKPARGDFLPILDGGYSLQYSPLLEYREGAGVVILCQLDVTGRGERDPAAETLARNLLAYAAHPTPRRPRRPVYAGDRAGRKRLETLGFSVSPWTGGRLSEDQVLILGPGGARQWSMSDADAREWFDAGGELLAIGLDQEEIDRIPWLTATVRIGEHLSTGLPTFNHGSRLAGIGPADLHIREPRAIPLVTGGARVLGTGILAEQRGVVYCQLVPWRFDGSRSMNLKRSERRVSFLLSRVMANMGVESATPLLERFGAAVVNPGREQRWLEGFYLDRPEEWDDPYRFFRW
jgi:hypothetical protein